MDTLLTAEFMANSPNFRRRSSTYVDAIHDLPQKENMAPAQLYSTESGRLFHSGRMMIATVGLPARGKTHISVALARYLRWLGVKTRIFHLGDYRRANIGEDDLPHDYFFVDASPTSVLLRQKILKRCREDILHFLEQENGQIAIYDAVNPLAAGRHALAKEFLKHNVQTLFIESHCTDERIIEENVRSVKISSPDYKGWDDKDAVRDYLQRINARIPHFETMEGSRDLHFIKMINAGERVVVNNCAFNYLSQRIVFYLLNLHIKTRRTYFARAGTTREDESFRADAHLSTEGEEYSKKMGDCLIQHREQERQKLIERGGPDIALKPLTIWTSTRRRTIETASYLASKGFKVRQRSQMSQLNPGVCEKLSEQKIREQYPDEVAKHDADPYHHRYPRAESYHDLAVRLEPVILELEREQSDLMIIAHESVLRVLYGYLMACSAVDIPVLEFPRNEIIEIIPASYSNESKRIFIADVPDKLVPASPEGIQMPVPPSGFVTPFSGIGSPAIGSPGRVATPSLEVDGQNSGRLSLKRHEHRPKQ